MESYIIKISFSIKALDEMDALIAERFSKYMAVRADHFEILRRVPVPVLRFI